MGEDPVQLKNFLKSGFAFGLISGAITALGLMAGLHSGTGSRLAVIDGIVTIAIADAFSDALGVHVAEESKNDVSPVQSGRTTLLSKAVFSLTFLVPLLIFDLSTAVIVAIVWGFQPGLLG